MGQLPLLPGIGSCRIGIGDDGDVVVGVVLMVTRNERYSVSEIQKLGKFIPIHKHIYLARSTSIVRTKKYFNFVSKI